MDVFPLLDQSVRKPAQTSMSVSVRSKWIEKLHGLEYLSLVDPKG